MQQNINLRVNKDLQGLFWKMLGPKIDVSPLHPGDKLNTRDIIPKKSESRRNTMPKKMNNTKDWVSNKNPY